MEHLESTASPLADTDPYGLEPSGAWLNRVHGFELDDSDSANGAGGCGSTVHFPRSCLHCENAACVTVCPTGASYKRDEDGIVLVDEDKCIGCGLCAWACPYGAREMDGVAKVMKKCTLCVDRIYNEHLPAEEREPACVRTCPARARHFGDLGDPDSDVSKLVAEREGVALMPELGYRPTNRYLPPRRQPAGQAPNAPAAQGPGARTRRLSRLARSRAQRLSLPPVRSTQRASSALHHPLHHRLGRRLRPPGLRGPGRAPRPRAGHLGERPRFAPAGAAAGDPGPLLLDPASRSPRARLASLQPVAVVLALARGCGRGHHLPAGAGARLALDHGRASGTTGCPGHRRSGFAHHLLHGHDLRVAEADPALASRPGARGLSRHGPRQRRQHRRRHCCLAERRCAAAVVAAGASRRRWRLAAQMALLAVDRKCETARHHGRRHRATRARHRAPARGGAHRAQLPARRDGLPHRPQAQRQAAPPCVAAGRHRAGHWHCC